MVEVDSSGALAISCGALTLFVARDCSLAFWTWKGKWLRDVEVGRA